MKDNRKNEEYGFARCSTKKQDVAYEVKALMDKGIKKENIFIEYESGSKEDREVFNDLLKIVKPGDSICATEVTRLARNMRNLIDIIDLVSTLKLRLQVGSLNVDCRTDDLDPITEVTLLVIGMFGMFDLKMKKHQIKLGLENAIAEGKVLGRPVKTKENISDIFYKYYAQYKNKQINLIELSKLVGCCRNTCYNYIHIIEES